jgi:hypothetical protein
MLADVLIDTIRTLLNDHVENRRIMTVCSQVCRKVNVVQWYILDPSIVWRDGPHEGHQHTGNYTSCARIGVIMKAAVLMLFFLSPQVIKNNPNGVWEAESGTRYSMQLTGLDLKVQIVEGSNPRFLKYEVDLKGSTKPEEANSYVGKGYFVTRFENGKECRFDTEWQLIVLSSDRIMGVTTRIVPDPETCAVKEKTDTQISLTKK